MTDTCVRDHPYTDDNTRWRHRVRPDRKATLTRICRRCEADAQQRSAWRKTHAAYLRLLADLAVPGRRSFAERREVCDV